MKFTLALLILALSIGFWMPTAGAQPARSTESAPIRDHRVAVPPKVAALQISECIKLGSDVVVDTSCPETTSTDSTLGSSIKGHFKCRGRGQAAGQGVCIDENEIL